MANKKKFVDPNAPVVEKEKFCRHIKENFLIIKNKEFNTDHIPWGFNWLLGYCEQSAQFTN